MESKTTTNPTEIQQITITVAIKGTEAYTSRERKDTYFLYLSIYLFVYIQEKKDIYVHTYILS